MKTQIKDLEEQIDSLTKQLEQNQLRLEHEQHKLQRLQNQKADLMDGSRKRRNRRLITRGAEIESIEPRIKPLSEKEFFSLAYQIFQLDSVRKLVTNFVNEHCDEGGD